MDVLGLDDPPYRKTQEAILRRVGANARAIRATRGITQEEAGFRSGIGYKRWQEIEAGRTNTTLLTISRMAAVLRVDVQKLFKP